MRWLLVSLAIAGCASAGEPNSIIGGLHDAGPRTDASDVPELDAATIDGPPGLITLSQTVSTAIKSDNSVACSATGLARTAPNSYYRVFPLSDHNITTTLHVTEVTFGIEYALAGGTAPAQPARVHLGTYGGTAGSELDLALVRSLGSVDIEIANTSGTRMTVPITADVAPASKLIVELEIPAAIDIQHRFYIGSNDGAERRPGYLRAPTCNFPDPTAIQSLTEVGQEVDILITVTGTL